MRSNEDRRTILIWEIICTSFLIGFGSVLHFLYEWTNHSSIMGLFRPCKWKYLGAFKIRFLVLNDFFGSWILLIGKKVKNFFIAKLFGIIALKIIIVVIFYTCTAILRKDLLVIDIDSYIVGAILCQVVASQIFLKIE